MTTTLDTIAATLATVSSVTYKISTRTLSHLPGGQDEVVVLSSLGSEIPEDGSDSREVREVMAAHGLELLDAGDEEGGQGFWSYWRPIASEVA